MADLIGLTASAAGGGLFGLIGTALGRAAGYFEKRQSHAHDRDRWAHEAHLITLQKEAAKEESETALMIAEADGRWAGLLASIKADAAAGPSYLWVNAVRGLTRPALTLLLWIIAAGIFVAADESGRAEIVETATFAATAATLWWFGDRGPKREGR